MFSGVIKGRRRKIFPYSFLCSAATRVQMEPPITTFTDVLLLVHLLHASRLASITRCLAAGHSNHFFIIRRSSAERYVVLASQCFDAFSLECPQRLPASCMHQSSTADRSPYHNLVTAHKNDGNLLGLSSRALSFRTHLLRRVFSLVITLPLPAPAAIHGVALAAASTSFTPGERAEEGSAGRVYFSQSRELGETAPRSQLRAKAHAPARSSLTVDRLAHSLADDLIGLPAAAMWRRGFLVLLGVAAALAGPISRQVGVSDKVRIVSRNESSDCEWDGAVYHNGEPVPNLANPCETCICSGGEVECSVIQCGWRNDCEGVYTDGACCPSYDHCPPKDAVEANEAVTQVSQAQEQVEVEASEAGIQASQDQEHVGVQANEAVTEASQAQELAEVEAMS
ncbi:hypothetical protein C7M84_000410 [Penaeus vannamei]|uniref:VWFC domain-containing protein n=1 Tax=Penaeus vannamei TaxID=6689 RepID=A0A3R7MMI9_PENVA|nr:hypothetical protein C7M84_000410 [Penaeus vannamei]